MPSGEVPTARATVCDGECRHSLSCDAWPRYRAALAYGSGMAAGSRAAARFLRPCYAYGLPRTHGADPAAA